MIVLPNNDKEKTLLEPVMQHFRTPIFNF